MEKKPEQSKGVKTKDMQKETKGSDKTEKKNTIVDTEKKAEESKGGETKETQKESLMKETIVDTENKPEQSKGVEAKGMQKETVIKGIESTEQTLSDETKGMKNEIVIKGSEDSEQMKVEERKDMQIETENKLDDTQSKDTDIATEKCIEPLDLKIVKTAEKKSVTFETESVKNTDNSCDPSPLEIKDSSDSPQVMKCGGGGSGLSKYFMKKESDTDEYEEFDEDEDEDGESIPCSQMRDVPHMLQ